MQYVAIVEEGATNDTDFIYVDQHKARLVYPTGKEASLEILDKYDEVLYVEGATKISLNYSDIRAIVLLARALGLDSPLYKLEKV